MSDDYAYVCAADHVTFWPDQKYPVIGCPYLVGRSMQCGRIATRQPVTIGPIEKGKAGRHPAQQQKESTSR